MASPNIAFDLIPASIRKPGKGFRVQHQAGGMHAANNQQKTLIVGQRLAAGTVAANTVVEVFSDADAANYFGRGSIAHLMVRSALKANPYLTLSVIAMDDGAGAAATNTVTVTGTATASGVLTVWGWAISRCRLPSRRRM